jgi:hypothetical protein
MMEFLTFSNKNFASRATLKDRKNVHIVKFATIASWKWTIIVFTLAIALVCGITRIFFCFFYSEVFYRIF